MKSESARAAAAIRTELKNNFPGVKFSITSDNYSGGNSISIRYLDAMVSEEVEKVINKYKAGNFNGMEDIYEYSKSDNLLPKAKYIFVERRMSEETSAELLNYIQNNFYGCKNLGMNEYSTDHSQHISCLVYREFRKKDYFFVDFAELLN